MRSAPVFPLCLRFKKPLSVALILVTIIAIIRSRGTLQRPFGQAPKVFSDPAVKVPGSPEWESFKFRQDLGRNLSSLFAEYRPPISAVNKSWTESWPTMPPFQDHKTYNYAEVTTASAGFFLKEESYSVFKKQQQALLSAIPAWDTVSKAFSGRGVVISAGASHLTKVWPNAILMLRALGCTLPVEIWTKDQNEYDLTLPLAQQMRKELKTAVSVHTLSDYMDIDWNGGLPAVFKVKALSLIYSSFEEIILLDADSVPAMDPTVLFDSEEAKAGLIQWPDFWSNSISKVLHDAYDINPDITPTCESGQMLINKKKQFEPLVLATYFNWWGPAFFYQLIYLDSMGTGDKDTFYLGAAAYHRKFHIVERGIELVRAVKLDGTLWKEGKNIFNGAMGQFDPRNTSEIFFMHMHSPKIDMRNPELEGQFDVQFFHPEKEQNISFAHGEHWLETKLWENLQWVECESIMRNLTANACNGISTRLASMLNKSN